MERKNCMNRAEKVAATATAAVMSTSKSTDRFVNWCMHHRNAVTFILKALFHVAIACICALTFYRWGLWDSLDTEAHRIACSLFCGFVLVFFLIPFSRRALGDIWDDFKKVKKGEDIWEDDWFDR